MGSGHGRLVVGCIVLKKGGLQTLSLPLTLPIPLPVPVPVPRTRIPNPNPNPSPNPNLVVGRIGLKKRGDAAGVPPATRKVQRRHFSLERDALHVGLR